MHSRAEGGPTLLARGSPAGSAACPRSSYRPRRAPSTCVLPSRTLSLELSISKESSATSTSFEERELARSTLHLALYGRLELGRLLPYTLLCDLRTEEREWERAGVTWGSSARCGSKTGGLLASNERSRRHLRAEVIQLSTC